MFFFLKENSFNRFVLLLAKTDTNDDDESKG